VLGLKVQIFLRSSSWSLSNLCFEKWWFGFERLKGTIFVFGWWFSISYFFPYPNTSSSLYLFSWTLFLDKSFSCKNLSSPFISVISFYIPCLA